MLRLRSQIESLQNKIDIASSISNYHDSCNYTRKITDLKQSIDQSRVKGEDLEKYLAEQNETWIKMFNQTKKEIMMKIDEINQQRCLAQIQDIVVQIKEKEDEIAEIQSEIDQITRQKTDEIQDEELNLLK